MPTTLRLFPRAFFRQSARSFVLTLMAACAIALTGCAGDDEVELEAADELLSPLGPQGSSCVDSNGTETECPPAVTAPVAPEHPFAAPGGPGGKNANLVLGQTCEDSNGQETECPTG